MAYDEPEYNDLKRYLRALTDIKHFIWSFPSVDGTVLEEQIRKGRSVQEEETEQKMVGKIIVLKFLWGNFKKECDRH